MAFPNELDWFLDSYLGKAFNLKQKHYMGEGKRRSTPRGQRSYLDDPKHVDLFRAIHQLGETELFKGDGSPKRPSDQFIADRLNSMGWGNIHGNPFNRKSINRIRNSEPYAIINSGSIDLPDLGGSNSP